MTIKQSVNNKSDVLVFGKHKGKTVQKILDEEASYILWLDKEEIVEFPKKIIEEAVEKADDQHREFLRENYDTGEYDDWGDRD